MLCFEGRIGNRMDMGRIMIQLKLHVTRPPNYLKVLFALETSLIMLLYKLGLTDLTDSVICQVFFILVTNVYTSL